MMKWITKASLIIAVLCSLSVPFLVTSSASALLNPTSKQDACQALKDNCNATAAATSLNNIIKATIYILSAIVGTVSVIMVIIGGLRYVTSGGDPSALSGARNTIIYALVGLVVAVLAQALVRFVLHRI